MNKSKGLTFILSFVPGLGHFYLGAMNRGLQLMIGFFGAMFISNILYFLGFLMPVIWFFGLFDALQQHRKMHDAGHVIDEPFFPWGDLHSNKHWIGWGLITLGVLFLMERFSFFYFGVHFYQVFKNILVGILLIILGWMLVTGKKLTRPSESRNEDTDNQDRKTAKGQNGVVQSGTNHLEEMESAEGKIESDKTDENQSGEDLEAPIDGDERDTDAPDEEDRK